MSLIDNSEARNKFMDIVVTIENTNKNDRMLNSLVNKNKEYLNRRMLSSKFEELLINKDKLSYNNRTIQKRRTSKYIKNFRNSLIISKKSKNFGFKRHITQSLKMPNNILEENIDKNEEKKNDIKTTSITHEGKEENKVKKRINSNDDFFLDEKKLKKLDDLKTFLRLIDTHKKTQYLIDLDPNRPKLDFIRNKNNLKLFKSSISYDKNNIYFSKKYKLIIDQLKKNMNNKNNNNFIIHTEDNRLNSFSSNISHKKKGNKNTFLKKKKILTISNDPNTNSCKLIYQKNNNKPKKNNINIYNDKLKHNNNYIRNDFHALSNENNKYGKYSLKSKNYLNTININSNISNYINSSRPQTSITSKSNKNKFKLSSQNETTEACETSSMSLVSDLNNLKTFNVSKKDTNLSKLLNFSMNPNIKFRNQNKKLLYEILSETLKKSNKLNNMLKFNSILKEKEEEKKNEQKIKDLTKKKQTNLELLVKDLNLHYDEQKIDLEELVIKNAYKLRQHLQNDKQFRIMNEVANKVIVEDKILSQEVFVESSLYRELRKRYKSKSDKEFEFLIEKRRYLKSKIKKYKQKTENEVITGLMKNEMFDFDNIKSLEEMLYKYRTMNHY